MATLDLRDVPALAEALAAAAPGEEIVVLAEGREVARCAASNPERPHQADRAARIAAVIEGLKEDRRGVVFGSDTTIEEMLRQERE